jgi:hypothetical protein
MKQFDLYDEWSAECEKLKRLNSIIQNDLNRLLQDGYCTKEDISNSIQEFEKLFKDRVEKLNELKVQICKLLEEKSK